MPRPQTDDELVLAGLRAAVRAGRAGAARDLERYLERRARAEGKALTATERRRQEADVKRSLQENSRRTKREDVDASVETQLSWRDDATADEHNAAYAADPSAEACVCRACTARAQQLLQDLLYD